MIRGVEWTGSAEQRRYIQALEAELRELRLLVNKLVKS